MTVQILDGMLRIEQAFEKERTFVCSITNGAMGSMRSPRSLRGSDFCVKPSRFKANESNSFEFFVEVFAGKNESGGATMWAMVSILTERTMFEQVADFFRS